MPHHLTGCRHSDRTAVWDLPHSADVYVDGIPPDGVATLARIRALLGTAWPFSDLRRLLTTQPFLAAPGGSPARLHRTLTQTATLRPYLFYDSPEGLHPVWPGP
ncbi:hypothetical protein [Dactylosporangium sp. NPDC000521]|uniref:hypothetical protein n=1 Tax=Dactylosporangium sp. NPDC000521 TaxID=3363975 RepID=UPI00368B1941